MACSRRRVGKRGFTQAIRSLSITLKSIIKRCLYYITVVRSTSKFNGSFRRCSSCRPYAHKNVNPVFPLYSAWKSRGKLERSLASTMLRRSVPAARGRWTQWIFCVRRWAIVVVFEQLLKFRGFDFLSGKYKMQPHHTRNHRLKLERDWG